MVFLKQINRRQGLVQEKFAMTGSGPYARKKLGLFGQPGPTGRSQFK